MSIRQTGANRADKTVDRGSFVRAARRAAVAPPSAFAIPADVQFRTPNAQITDLFEKAIVSELG
jgi:hypothetical protein